MNTPPDSDPQHQGSPPTRFSAFHHTGREFFRGGGDGAIGASPPRPDAPGKVTGDTRYPGDLVAAGSLYLKAVFAHRPHALVRRIDASAALALPGVEAVLTAEDVPYNAFGLIDDDQPVLCGDRVRWEGDKVALVVAESKAVARAAAQLVRVEYEDLPAVTDARAALEVGAPLVHPERGTNVLTHVPIRKGDAEAALATTDVVVAGEFSTGWQEHAFLQPEAGVAYIDERGRLVVETAGQWLHEDRRQIAAMLRLPEDQVVIRYAAIGGAFGGREDLSIQHVLALAAWKLRRRVALVWNRDESIVGHHKRHPFRIRCRWGANRDGRIVAVSAELVADGGAYASTTAEVVKCAALFASGCYEVPNIAVDAYGMYTNNIPSGAFRGFGAPQAQWAAESMVGRLAQALGIDAVELRRRNIYREGSLEPTQQPLPPGVGALQVLERCVAEARTRGMIPGIENQEPRTKNQEPIEPGNASASRSAVWPEDLKHETWSLKPGARNSELGTRNSELGTRNPELGTRNSELETRNSKLGTRIRRGVGIACGIKNVGYSFGFPEQSTATVELHGAGTIEHAHLRIGAADVGQGSHLILRQIVAEQTGLPIDRIIMIADDSSETPNAGSASASRLTLMAGRAVFEATAAALKTWQDEERPAIATAQYRPPATTPLDPVTTAGRPNYAYGYASQAVEVEVDTLTGLVRVLRVISVHDVGRAINRQQVEGQIEGCLAQALGYTLLEHFQVHDGHVLTPNLSTYLLPTALDMPPEIVPVILELADPNGPYGARGVAEMPLVPFAPAVAAAIYDATGAWLDDLPLTPERVLAALDALQPDPDSNV